MSIEVERYGDETGVPLLLISGFGSQLISWPTKMIEALAGAGFSVIAMDNRDAGLSEKLSRWGVPDIAPLRSKPRVLPSEVPYTLADMSDDAAGVLDALGLPAAHVVGKSMGGLIAQSLCARHPDRVLSLSLLITTSAAPSVPAMRPDIEALLFGDSDAPADLEAIIEASVEADKAWASPAYPFDPAERRALALASLKRGHNPDGVARQAAALLCELRGGTEPRHLDVPALVVQGMADTIFPPEHGRDLARRITGAELLEVEGMGHDLEGGAVGIVTEAIIRCIRSAELRQNS
ncbi:alpha/beta fold hydrolase [Defluviimonas sp. CAU 1641]|uniref:Alpha/beta fold hydrolase n=1 Tax=Defluviimonas salinarum TaxID=2992147 RepID=A0ABT3J3Y7_9RHOB|nr:alpha/beta fold hydrolase [Defluviimonas salinarum]